MNVIPRPDKATIDYWKAYGELVLIVLGFVWIAYAMLRHGAFPTLKAVASAQVGG